ncbi:MAG: helix-turn-helix domain-containing protein [Chloroflexi bacterium]|nr:helix-turn-helix domain-containing protein [Chloroflexota bacterium]
MVLAGADGLDNEVSWPATLRVRPPAFAPLSGHELALVSSEALELLDPPVSLAQLIERLAERGVAGVVIVGTADAAAIAVANRAHLPLLQLPEIYHLTDLGPVLSRVIAEEKTRLYQLGLDVQHQLAEISMTGRGLRGIVARLAELTARDVILQNSGGELVARANGVPASDDASGADRPVPPIEILRAAVPRSARRPGDPPAARIHLPAAAGLTVPVMVRDAVAGYLTLLASADDFTEEDRIVLARGSAVCALELAKQEAVVAAEHRLRGDFFDDLLEGANESADSLIARGRHLGYDVQKPRVALVAVPDAARGGNAAGIERITREITGFLAGRGLGSMVAPRRESVVVFLEIQPAGDGGAVRRTAEDLRAYLASAPGLPVSVGIGTYHPGVLGLRTSYHEAEQAARIGREIFGPGQVTAFADLGVYRLVYAFRDRPELADFVQETIGTLIEYDTRNRTQLVDTLETYFRCNASLAAAAEALHLHRNSLAYRLRRIVDLTGLRLDSVEDRFRLQLALKARRVIHGSPTQGHRAPVTGEGRGEAGVLAAGGAGPSSRTGPGRPSYRRGRRS